MSTRTIDITPTWVDMIPMITLCIESGGSARKAGLDEMKRMAEAADMWNAHAGELMVALSDMVANAENATERARSVLNKIDGGSR